MKREPRTFAGLALLVTAALIVAVFQFWPDDPGPKPPKPPALVTVSGLVGNKAAFFDDPEVTRILKERFGVTVDYTVMSSSQQRAACHTPHDFCWPDSQSFASLIKEDLGPSVLKSETVFNSPIVFYSWTDVTNALIEQGLVTKTGDTYYLSDFSALVELIERGQSWSEVGLPQLYGKIHILTADPKSNSGSTYAALLVNTLNGGAVVNAQTVEPLLPRLPPFFEGLLLPDSTAVFKQFLNLGIGAAPIAVGYENALIEHALAQPAQQAFLKAEVQTLYPQPTIWSSQNMLALTEGGKRLLAALQDPEVQQIGWAGHGFRPGNTAVRIDPATVPVMGVPATIVSVMSMPAPTVTLRIVDYLVAPPPVVSPATSPIAATMPIAALRPEGLG